MFAGKAGAMAGKGRPRLAGWLVGAGLVLGGGYGCSGGESGTLEQIRDAGELRVLTHNSPRTYYLGPDGEKGLEYDLTRRFAEELGVDLKVKVINDFGGILEALKDGKGHLAAAGITRTSEREKRFDFGPAYQTVEQEVICRRGRRVPGDWEDLPEIDLLVLSGTSYVERLKEIKQVIHDLRWEETDALSIEQILQRVWKGQVDCTVADSTILAMNRRYYPELVVAFPISPEQELAWALPQGSEALQKRLEGFFEGLRKNSELAGIRDRYFGHVRIFDYVDITTFQQRIRSRLPKYKPLFQRAARDFPFSWKLLAAQAYQESHWRPRARSPTGVRGMMMLTLVTARSLGIENRMDVEASVRGGARYLAKLIRQVPESIEEPDRTWVALAAYNVGMGHIRDARRLAEREGMDPDHWNSLKKMLPRLSQRKYYKNLPYGYARGTEPVIYVRRIRQYLDVLRNHFRETEEVSAERAS